MSSRALEVEDAPPASLRWRDAAPLLGLGLILLGVLVMYWPALNAPFYADDYLYLNAANQLDAGDYLEASIVPKHRDEYLGDVTGNFWRPLYYLAFPPLESVFGSSPAGYHAVVLAVHIANIGVLWLLARQLTGSVVAAFVAAGLFALHPAGFESVAWISALNSVALGFAMAGWWSFAQAVGDGSAATRRGWLASAVVLIALGLGFRESAAVVLPAMAAWYGLVVLGREASDWRRWLSFVPFALLLLLYLLVRTRALTEPLSDDPLYRWDTTAIEQWWWYVKVSVFPIERGAPAPAEWLARVVATITLASLAFAAWRRQWLVVALLVGFLVSLVPYAPLRLAALERYVYFPVAFLALAVGAAAGPVLQRMGNRTGDRLGVSSALCGFMLLLGLFAASGRDRIVGWEREEIGPQQAWVQALRAAYSELPDGGTLYCADVPLILAIYDAVLLQPTAQFWYPGIARADRFEPNDLAALQQTLEPNDRIFIYGRAEQPPAPQAR